MRFLILTIVAVIYFHGFSQSDLKDSLEKMVYSKGYITEPNKLIPVLKQLLPLENERLYRKRIQLKLSQAYLKTGDLKKAKQYFRKGWRGKLMLGLDDERFRRGLNGSRNDANQVFYDYYYTQGNFKKAIRHLDRFYFKKLPGMCGTYGSRLKNSVAEQKIDCLENLGKCKRADRLRKKVYSSLQDCKS